MEKFKNVLLFVLVALSIYLSYCIMYEQDHKDKNVLPRDKNNVVSYKRFYKVGLPSRESFDEIPEDELSKFVANALLNSEGINKIDTEGIKDENKNSDMFPFYALPSFDNGYLAVSGFDIPLKLLFLSTGKEAKTFPFDTIKKFYINNSEKSLYVYTENGLFETDLDAGYEGKSFNKYITLDEDYLPEASVGINNFATVENPMENYRKKDRTSIAEQFLGEKNVFEIEDEKNYTYSSDTASVTMGKNGIISYLKSPPTDMVVVTLYDSLVDLKNFVKNAPLTFSNYRILRIDTVQDDEYKVYLIQGNQPGYGYGQTIYEAVIKRNRVVKFVYNSVYVKEYDKVFRKPDIKEYREAIKNGEDPVFYYRGHGTGTLKTGKLGD